MTKLQDIQFCKSCMTDPLGRVFFYRGRIFRAIDPKYEARFLSFLQSELYQKLLEKGWIVKTWVTKEITIDGFSLIVEHERMFVSRPQEWSFEMQKEVALSTLRILKLCNQYGYTFGDAMPGNFAWCKGRPVLIDLGALKEGNRDQIFDEQFAKWQYLLLSVYVHMGGSGIDCLMHGQGKVYQTRFPQNRNFAPYMLTLLRGAIEHYYLFHHVNSWKIKVRSLLWFNIARWINELVRLFSKRIGSRELIKCGQIRYKPFDVDDIECMRSPTSYSSHYFDIDVIDNTLIHALSSMNIDLSGKSVAFIGNFEYDSLCKIQNITNNTVTVITHDMSYADTLFKQLHGHTTDINILCIDPVTANAEEGDWGFQYCCDIVIMDNFWWVFSTDKQVTFPVYRIESIVEMLTSICKQYVLVPPIALDQQLLFETSFQKIEGLYDIDNEYTLFRKKGQPTT